MSARPVAVVLVPTHDHPATLDLAVRSALEQTVAEIEVLIVGDGVGEETREVAAGLLREDERVRFLDLPKGPNHGEVHRGTAIEGTAAEIVCYLCDDDLLLPEHVASMREQLAEADLAHSQNGHLEADGTWHHIFADLSSPACRAWVLRPDRNVVSLTGTAHTVAAYRRLPHGWRTTPPERWPDHYMWQQFLTEPWVRAATAPRVTALQFPSYLGGRDEWPHERRRAELEKWRATLATAKGRALLEATIGRAVRTQATAEWLRREELEPELKELRELHVATVAEAAALRAHLSGIESTRTWRLSRRVRRIFLRQ
ncbi:MAG TPA: glycosyltransferase family A protein [Solirubrobacterales bacterium]|nr:glycosyltransferase family A protein [Solirubrobacterales bacterium]